MTHYSEGRRWSDKWNMWVLDDVQPANGAAPDKQQDLIETLERIADDYHPDRDADAPQALQEMRDALTAAIAVAKQEDQQ